MFIIFFKKIDKSFNNITNRERNILLLINFYNYSKLKLWNLFILHNLIIEINKKWKDIIKIINFITNYLKLTIVNSLINNPK